MDALDAIRNRRSIGRLKPPAPTDDDLRTILKAAAAAPDHGELRPFRFTILDGDAQDAFGMVLEQAYRARCAETAREPEPDKAAKERTKLGRAPIVIVVHQRGSGCCAMRTTAVTSIMAPTEARTTRTPLIRNVLPIPTRNSTVASSTVIRT